MPLVLYSAFWAWRQAEVLGRLLLIVAADQVIALGVVRIELCGLVEGLHRLLELALAVVVAGDRVPDRRVGRAGVAGLQEGRFGLLVAAGVLVNLRQLEVGRRLVRVHLDHPLDDRLGLGRVVELVGGVGGDDVFHGAALDQRVLGQLGGLGVVLDGLGHQGIVFRLTLADRLPHVVVAVPEEEVGGEEIRSSFRIRIGRDHSFVTVGGLAPARRPIVVVGLFEGLHGLQVVERILATAGRGGAEPYCEHCNRHRRRPIPGLHVLPRGATTKCALKSGY